MRTSLGAALAAVSLVLVAGCGSDGSDPVADPTAGSSTGPSSGDPTTPTDAPSQTGDGDLDCLVSGSPWHVSLPDLESQFAGVMRGINVTGVHIVGAQTLAVDSDLHATFADNSTTTINVDMGNGLAMVMVQRHRGSATGTLRATTNKLTANGWTGGIRGSTKVTINGRASQAPFSAPTGGIGEHPMTYSCADGTMNLSVQGSPFQYLFVSG